MSAFSDQLAADAAAVFLNAREFAREVTWCPLGVVAAGFPITVLFFEDDESPSDASLSDRDGKRVPRFAELEAPITLEVDDRDTVIVGDETWQVVKVSGRDEALQTVKLRNNSGISTKRGRPQP